MEFGVKAVGARESEWKEVSTRVLPRPTRLDKIKATPRVLRGLCVSSGTVLSINGENCPCGLPWQCLFLKEIFNTRVPGSGGLNLLGCLAQCYPRCTISCYARACHRLVR